MSENIKNKGEDILANVIMYILKNDIVSMGDIINRFKLSIESAENIINTMVAANIISETNNDGINNVIVNSLDDINEGIIEFLNDNSFDNNEISKAFKALTTAEKDEVSIILNENRDWNNVDSAMPDENVPVIIRMIDRSMIYTENRTEVLYAEDMKIAQWDGTKWTIIPPYPRYDYSPLSKFSELNKGTVVTHWALVDADELHGWNTRFDRINPYNLTIEVDPEYEEDVYRALMWGAAFISKFGGPDFTDDKECKGLRKLYNVLCDMQACIDNNPKSLIAAPLTASEDKPKLVTIPTEADAIKDEFK